MPKHVDVSQISGNVSPNLIVYSFFKKKIIIPVESEGPETFWSQIWEFIDSSSTGPIMTSNMLNLAVLHYLGNF